MSDGGILDQPMSTSDSAVGTDTPLATAATLPTLHSVVEDAERGHIRKALTHCDGSVGKTDDVLGISRKTLWEKETFGHKCMMTVPTNADNLLHL